MSSSSVFSFTKIVSNIKSVAKTQESGTELKKPTIKFRPYAHSNNQNPVKKTEERMTLAELFGQCPSPKNESDLSVNINESHELIDSQLKEEK